MRLRLPPEKFFENLCLFCCAPDIGFTEGVYRAYLFQLPGLICGYALVRADQERYLVRHFFIQRGLRRHGLTFAYMVYGNYRALLEWNRSLYFATAVGILSDRLR